jgi:hypothetical protein
MFTQFEILEKQQNWMDAFNELESIINKFPNNAE